MIEGKRIAVVVPAFNEADKISWTVRSIPSYVDHLIVVDDGSRDATAARAEAAFREHDRGRGREVLRHPQNRGVGAAIATGYQRAVELGVDAVAVMAGDAQMDPRDLPALLAPVLCGDADYTKGNRFAWPDGARAMPFARRWGNWTLSWLTRFATGYPALFDSQCGYTVASRRALHAIAPQGMFTRYGYPNDLLGRLAAASARVVDVPVRPVYGPSWRSGLQPWRVAWPISRLLLRMGLERVRRGLGRSSSPVERSTEPLHAPHHSDPVPVAASRAVEESAC
jgi:GT2 family glycosyltransferase